MVGVILLTCPSWIR